MRHHAALFVAGAAGLLGGFALTCLTSGRLSEALAIVLLAIGSLALSSFIELQAEGRR